MNDEWIQNTKPLSPEDAEEAFFNGMKVGFDDGEGKGYSSGFCAGKDEGFDEGFTQAIARIENILRDKNDYNALRSLKNVWNGISTLVEDVE